MVIEILRTVKPVAAQRNHGLSRPLAPEPYEACLDLSRLSTTHCVVPSTTSCLSR
jgi:hypothetical protein